MAKRTKKGQTESLATEAVAETVEVVAETTAEVVEVVEAVVETVETLMPETEIAEIPVEQADAETDSLLQTLEVSIAQAQGTASSFETFIKGREIDIARWDKIAAKLSDPRLVMAVKLGRMPMSEAELAVMAKQQELGRQLAEQRKAAKIAERDADPDWQLAQFVAQLNAEAKAQAEAEAKRIKLAAELADQKIINAAFEALEKANKEAARAARESGTWMTFVEHAKADIPHAVGAAKKINREAGVQIDEQGKVHCSYDQAHGQLEKRLTGWLNGNSDLRDSVKVTLSVGERVVKSVCFKSYVTDIAKEADPRKAFEGKPKDKKRGKGQHTGTSTFSSSNKAKADADAAEKDADVAAIVAAQRVEDGETPLGDAMAAAGFTRSEKDEKKYGAEA